MRIYGEELLVGIATCKRCGRHLIMNESGKPRRIFRQCHCGALVSMDLERRILPNSEK